MSEDQTVRASNGGDQKSSLQMSLMDACGSELNRQLRSKSTLQKQRLARKAGILLGGGALILLVGSNDNESAKEVSIGMTLRSQTIKAPDNYLSPRFDKEQCDIYLARSSLPHVNGFGIFTASHVKEGTTISTFDGPSIPITDFEFYAHNPHGLEDDINQFRQVFQNYWWAIGMPDYAVYESSQVYDYTISFGSLPNHHCVLGSLEYVYASPTYDDTLLGENDPGLGALSYHAGKVPQLYRSVTAGSEIFLNYGFCQREGDSPQWAESIPKMEDYEDAGSLSTELWTSLLDQGLVTEDGDKAAANDHITAFRTAHNNTSSIVSTLLPTTVAQLRPLILTADGKKQEKRLMSQRLALITGSTPRTPAWLRENGQCLESLVVGRSTIPHAGRGAFAQFAISAGGIVVPAPTLHITNRDVLKTFNHRTSEQVGMQLLLNYCFGHSQSSMLFCPQTNAILINHCSAENPQSCGEGPNARVQWASKKWDDESDKWLRMTIEEIAEKPYRGISMEIVALREIQKGEEVVIDYGPEWNAAWETHVAKWEAPQRDDYVSASLANDSEEMLNALTSGDLRSHDEHPNLFTGCVYGITDSDSFKKWNKQTDWEEWKDEKILSAYAEDGSQHMADFATHSDGTHWPCTVIREEEEGRYTVRIWRSDLADLQGWTLNNLPRILTNYPRDSIRVFHKPYKSDQHLKHAFRHHIGIPDEILPSQWRNRA